MGFTGYCNIILCILPHERQGGIMTRNISLICRVLVVVTLLWYYPAQAQINVIYVSLHGNDAWSGLLPDVNNAKSDGPVASLQKAIGAVRNMKITKPNQQYRIEMREGIYYLNQPVLIYKEDSGLENNPVVITSYRGEKPVISGGVEITNFQAVKNDEIKRLLPEGSRDKVLQAKIDRFPYYRLELNNKDERFFELFYKGEPLHLSRYPRNAFLEIADVRTTPKDTNIIFSEPDVAFLANEKDLYCHGYWGQVWYDDYQKVKYIDVAARSVSFLPPQSRYGYVKEQRFYFTNVLSKISEPGDYAFDGAAKTVYVYPKETDASYHITAPVVTNLMKFSDASWVEVKGIIFEESVSHSVVISKGSHVAFDSCTFRNMSAEAIQAYDVSYFTAKNSFFENLGAGGVEIHGGDRAHLVSAHNVIDNNEFHDFSRLIRTHSPAIQVIGVGALVSHNVIYNASYTGIYFEGNDNIIEYNELYNLGFETGIGGAIYTWGNQTFLGNEIRYNYIHDVHGHGGYSFRGIHVDGFVSGVSIHHNILSSCQQGILIEGGSYNTIENNLFYQCDRAVTVEQVFNKSHEEQANSLRSHFKVFTGNEALWKNKYPLMGNVISDTSYLPVGNVFKHNIVVGKKWLDTTAKDTSIILQNENYVSEDNRIVDKQFRVNTSLLPSGLQSAFTPIDFLKAGHRGGK
jgi:parallel beta-helix repeat protein